jgi:hypothetical protein
MGECDRERGWDEIPASHAVAVFEMHVNGDADVQTAVTNSLGNQHVWRVS